MKKSSVIPVIPAISAICGILFIAYYVFCGILYSFTLSGLWIWLSFGLILIFGCTWRIIAEPKIRKEKSIRIYRPLKTACLSLLALFILVFLVFEVFLISEWISGYDDNKNSPDVIIVLGAAVDYDHPGDALAKRIEAAYEYIQKNPGTAVIACGGMGTGDILSEAECIKRELTALGVPEETILAETASTTTSENFQYAAELIPEGTDSAAVVTSGFHLLRAKLTGQTSFSKAGNDSIRLIPISASCGGVLLPYNMVREFAAFVRDFSDGNIDLDSAG